MVKTVGVYTNKVCPNNILRSILNNKLEVELEEHCSWCAEAHKFSLKEVVELK